MRRTGGGEYGATALEVLPARRRACSAACPPAQQVWMSHGDTCAAAPPGFTVTARTGGTPVAAAEDPARQLYGVQFHPEVLHTEHGMETAAPVPAAPRAAGRRGPCAA